MAVYGSARKAGRTYRSFACAANRTRGPSICDGRSIGEAKVVQAIAETIRVTAADLLPEFISAFEVEWKRELTQQAATSPMADLETAIARQAARVDKLAAAVADAPDIGPLLAQLREANARLGELRERRAKEVTVKIQPAADLKCQDGSQMAFVSDDQGPLKLEPSQGQLHDFRAQCGTTRS